MGSRQLGVNCDTSPSPVSPMRNTCSLVILWTLLSTSRANDDNISSRSFGNDNFASTLTGMMGALQEMQAKGDKMIAEVQKQKEVLEGVKKEIEDPNNTLTNITKSV